MLAVENRVKVKCAIANHIYSSSWVNLSISFASSIQFTDHYCWTDSVIGDGSGSYTRNMLAHIFAFKQEHIYGLCQMKITAAHAVTGGCLFSTKFTSIWLLVVYVCAANRENWIKIHLRYSITKPEKCVDKTPIRWSQITFSTIRTFSKNN